MKTSHILASVVALAGIGVGIFIQNRCNDAKLAKLRKELNAIHMEATAAAADRADEDERPQRVAPAIVPFVQAAAPSSEAQPNEPEHAPPTVPAKPHSWTAQDLSDHYAAAFTAEDEDADWASRARQTAEERVRADLPAGSELRSVECRASICRIETSHADRDGFREFARRAFNDPTTGVWNGGSFSTIVSGNTDPGTPIVVVSYLAREGSNLPPPDPSEQP